MQQRVLNIAAVASPTLAALLLVVYRESGSMAAAIFVRNYGLPLVLGSLLPTLLLPTLNYLQYGRMVVSSLFIEKSLKALEDEEMSRVLRPHYGPEPEPPEMVRTGVPLTEQQRRSFNALEHTTATTQRLTNEIRELGRRGNVNLGIGILTTAFGVGVLGAVVWGTLNDVDDFGGKSIMHVILRVSIAIFIQTFAYFFLRLYKTCLEDIKFYQNEITNLDAKLLALYAALGPPERPQLLKYAIEALAKTERNFVLKKGDTTTGLEREKLERNEIVDLVKHAMSVSSRVKPATKSSK